MPPVPYAVGVLNHRSLQATWFAALLDRYAPCAVQAGRRRYRLRHGVGCAGRRPTTHGLWVLAVRFTLLAMGSLLGVMLLLRWLLQVNLRGLYALRTAARAMESGDLNARASLAHGSPPEVHETKLAFNHMADHVIRLVTELEHEHADLLVEKECLRVMIQSIGDAVVVTDAEGLAEFLNPRAER